MLQTKTTQEYTSENKMLDLRERIIYMDIKNVKISVDNLEELLNGEHEAEIIGIMRQALIQVRNNEGHYDVTKEIEELKIEDPAKIEK